MNNNHIEKNTTQSNNNNNDCIRKDGYIKKLTLSDLSSNSFSSFFLKPKENNKEIRKRFSDIYTYRDMYEYTKGSKHTIPLRKLCSFEGSDFVFGCNNTLTKNMKKKLNLSLIEDFENNMSINPKVYTIHSNRNNCCCCHCTCCHACTMPYNVPNRNSQFYMKTDGTLALSAIPIQKPVSRIVSRRNLVDPIFIPNLPTQKPKVINIKNKTQYFTADSRGMQKHDLYTRRPLTIPVSSNGKTKKKLKIDYEDQLDRELRVLEEFDRIEIPIKKSEDSKIKSKKYQEIKIVKAKLAREEDIFINQSNSNVSKIKTSRILKDNDSLTSLDDFVRSPYNYYKNQNIDRKLYNNDYSTDSVSVGSIDHNSINKENIKEAFNKSRVKEAPTFNLMPKSFIGKGNENAKFKCTFNGFPEPTVTWFINKVNLKTLDMPHKYKMYSKRNGAHYLKIFNLKPYDCGRITCSIENSMGRSEACANLTILNDEGDF
jgi:hypothetical protein